MLKRFTKMWDKLSFKNEFVITDLMLSFNAVNKKREGLDRFFVCVCVGGISVHKTPSTAVSP